MPHAPIVSVFRKASGRQKHFGLDWLRALASILVVVFHAGIPYMSAEFPGLVWCIDDAPARSAVMDAVCWKIDTFIMPLFFVMSGFLACQSCRHSCPFSLARSRIVRLGVPFLLAVVVVLPVEFYVWLTGWVIDGRISLQQMRPRNIGPILQESLGGVAHLWYLQSLLVFCVGAGLIVGAKRKLLLSSAPVNPKRSSSTGARLLTAGLVVLGCFLTSASALCWKPCIVIGFHLTCLPHPANLLYYAPCFALGWFWNSFEFRPSRATGLAALSAAAGLFFATLPLISAHVAKPEAGSGLLRLVLAFVACGWLAAFGWATLALNTIRPVTPAVEYLSRASLWIYLVHLPICGLTQIALRTIEVGGIWKCAIVTATTLGFCLLTYEAAVRNRLLDRLVNGIQPRVALGLALTAAGQLGVEESLPTAQSESVETSRPRPGRKRVEPAAIRRHRHATDVHSFAQSRRHAPRREQPLR